MCFGRCFVRQLVFVLHLHFSRSAFPCTENRITADICPKGSELLGLFWGSTAGRWRV